MNEELKKAVNILHVSWAQLLSSLRWLKTLDKDSWTRKWISQCIAAVDAAGTFDAEDFYLNPLDVSRDPVGFFTPILGLTDTNVPTNTQSAIFELDKLVCEKGWWSLDDPRRLRFLARFFYKNNNSDTLFIAEDVANMVPGRNLRPVHENCQEGVFVALEGSSRIREIQGGGECLLMKTFMYVSELNICHSVQLLCNQDPVNFELRSHVFEGCDPVQEAAACLSIASPLSFVLGPGGCGKTSRVARSIWRAQEGQNIVALAPTHVAKRRLMEELETGPENVRTVHSFTWSFGFRASRLRQTICEAQKQNSGRFVILVDEGSMISTEQMERILEDAASQVTPGFHVSIIFFGDENQLPPINRGMPFVDLINNSTLPRSVLKRVYRAETVELAHFCKGLLEPNWTLNPSKAEALQLKAPGGSIETTFVDSEKEILEVVRQALRDRPGYQIVTHTNENCVKFAHVVREIRYPRRRLKFPNDAFAPGDVVLFNSNARFWRNGDAAEVLDRVVGRNERCERYLLLFDPAEELHGKPIDSGSKPYRDDVRYPTKMLVELYRSEIVPSTARTIHKCQGTGFDDILFIMMGSNDFCRSRQFIYTACSRAKRHLRLVGRLGAFNGRSAHTSEKRRTLLPALLRLSGSAIHERLAEANALVERLKLNSARARADAWRGRYGNDVVEASCDCCGGLVSWISGFFIARSVQIWCRHCYANL